MRLYLQQNYMLPHVLESNLLKSLTLLCALVCCHMQALAQKEMPVTRDLHPWQAAMPSITAESYFTNLPLDGKIKTPFVLKFGLSGGWGIAPIAKPIGGKSGHHHLFINTALPLDLTKPLAFSESHLHFGKGQMETVLNLAPGKHKLRLLFADNEHKLHFVYSKDQTVIVTAHSNEIDPKSLTKKEISFLNLPSAATLKSPFRLQFHASGFNIGHLQQHEKDTGHFRLLITPERGGKTMEIAFANGQTEARLSPPAGSYKLKLELVSNEVPNKLLAESPATGITIQ